MKVDVIKVRVGSEEKRAFQEAADIAGIGMSAWIRERLRRAAIRELEEMARPIPFFSSPSANASS